MHIKKLLYIVIATNVINCLLRLELSEFSGSSSSWHKTQASSASLYVDYAWCPDLWDANPLIWLEPEQQAKQIVGIITRGYRTSTTGEQSYTQTYRLSHGLTAASQVVSTMNEKVTYHYSPFEFRLLFALCYFIIAVIIVIKTTNNAQWVISSH